MAILLYTDFGADDLYVGQVEAMLDGCTAEGPNQFAVKSLSSALSGDPDFRQRFFEEARKQATLKHRSHSWSPLGACPRYLDGMK